MHFSDKARIKSQIPDLSLKFLDICLLDLVLIAKLSSNRKIQLNLTLPTRSVGGGFNPPSGIRKFLQIFLNNYIPIVVDFS